RRRARAVRRLGRARGGCAGALVQAQAFRCCRRQAEAVGAAGMMNEPEQSTDPFEAMFPRQSGIDGNLVVDVEGFEGPLDLLLTLARAQKVDLKKISILALADQYLTFVSEARRLRLELAADYLVMAAWLAYLKSRLLLPEPETSDAEPSGEELAARLAFQLQR